MKNIPLKRLTKFRSAWLPDKIRAEVWPQFQKEDRIRMTELAFWLQSAWSKVQFLHRDGTVLREGEPASAAFRTK